MLKVLFCPFHGLRLEDGPLGGECPYADEFCDVAWGRVVYGKDLEGRLADRLLIEGLCLGGG